MCIHIYICVCVYTNIKRYFDEKTEILIRRCQFQKLLIFKKLKIRDDSYYSYL